MKHIVKVENLLYLPVARPLIAMGNNGKISSIYSGPANNEIWYWGEYYDLANVISTLEQQFTYAGPAIVSNEQVGDKYVITFNGPVTKLGTEEESGVFLFYPVFTNASEIVSCKIPNSVTNISDWSFYGCTSLTSMTIPNSVINITDGAFNDLASLTSPIYNSHVFAYMQRSYSGTYIIPDGIESIVGFAFSGCDGLTSITIPNSIKSIGDQSFDGCTSLTSVMIPISVTQIGESTFCNCTGLTSVTCEATIPPAYGLHVFDNTNDCPIYVPAQSVDTYKSSWSTYASRIYAISA